LYFNQCYGSGSETVCRIRIRNWTDKKIAIFASQGGSGSRSKNSKEKALKSHEKIFEPVVIVKE
jgi:hypothetical protein